MTSTPLLVMCLPSLDIEQALKDFSAVRWFCFYFGLLGALLLHCVGVLPWLDVCWEVLGIGQKQCGTGIVNTHSSRVPSA